MQDTRTTFWPIDEVAGSSQQYYMYVGGEHRGEMRYHVQREEGKLIIRDTSELYGQVWEQMMVRIDQDDPSVWDLDITMDYPQSKAKIEGVVKSNQKQISGEYIVDQPANLDTSVVEIAQGSDIIPRAAIFALAPVMDMAEGAERTMKLYAASSGEVWDMRLVHEGYKDITIEDESVKTKIYGLRGGKLENLIYISQEDNSTVRIDVLGMDMQLIKQ